MIGYPRWKIVLVAIVMVIGIFLALPNVFGEESALQLAATARRSPMPTARRWCNCSRTRASPPRACFWNRDA